MKFSAQEEYGLRCLLSIAKKGRDNYLTIAEISRMEGLSQPHVAKLLSILRKASWIQSSRGQNGGYTLATHPSKIRITEVLAKLGGRLYEPGFCTKYSGLYTQCSHASHCELIPLWTKIQSAVDQVLANTTLEDLLNGQLSEGEERCPSLLLKQKL